MPVNYFVSFFISSKHMSGFAVVQCNEIILKLHLRMFVVYVIKHVNGNCGRGETKMKWSDYLYVSTFIFLAESENVADVI
jgi:hypothetical protein